eukprot:6354272-Amphidinium_carterae.1
MEVCCCSLRPTAHLCPSLLKLSLPDEVGMATFILELFGAVAAQDVDIVGQLCIRGWQAMGLSAGADG